MAETLQFNLTGRLNTTATAIPQHHINLLTAPLLGPTGQAPVQPMPVYLTAESLLLYCESQLRSLDTEVTGFLNEQRANIDRKKALGDVIAQMKKYSPPATAAQAEEHYKAVHAAAAALPAGDPIATLLHDVYSEVASTGNPTKAQWDAAMEKLQGALDEVSGNAEINMIRLQTVMSQRQMAIQLTTGMLQKFDQGLMAPINNIGR